MATALLVCDCYLLGVCSGYLPDSVSTGNCLPALNVGQGVPEAAAAGVAVPVQGTAAGFQLGQGEPQLAPQPLNHPSPACPTASHCQFQGWIDSQHSVVHALALQTSSCLA